MFLFVIGCSEKKYGRECASDCSIYCINGECNHGTGNCSCVSPITHGGIRCDQPCPENCGTEGCNQDLTCSGCKPGWWGPHCNLTCPLPCRLDDRVTHGCLQHSNGDCILCEDGFYGHKCKQTCPVNCDSACEKESGECSCKEGYYGSDCNFTCSTDCKTTRCEKENGNCACRPGYKTGQCISS